MKKLNNDFMIMVDDSDDQEISLTIIISHTTQKERSEYAARAKAMLKELTNKQEKETIKQIEERIKSIKSIAIRTLALTLLEENNLVGLTYYVLGVFNTMSSRNIDELTLNAIIKLMKTLEPSSTILKKLKT